MRRPLSIPSLFIAVSIALAGCGQAGDPDLLTEEGAEALEDVGGKADHLSIPFTAFEDPAGIGSKGEKETRVVIKSAAAYRSYFGHAAPRSVDFSTDYVFFYSAGVKSTGGYTASVERVWRSQSGFTIYVATKLEAPGAGCFVTQALTKPYVLVKFKKQPQAGAFRTQHESVTNDCNVNPCAAVLCGPGTQCVVHEVQCIRAPCPPIASCEPIQVTGPFCGGIAGIRCPGAGECVDNPNDDCDPARGGADCGGVCQCNALAKCVAGYVFDRSPEVCGCVPDPSADPCASVRCAAGTRCQAVGGSAYCVSDGTLKCGNNTCAAGQVCCNASCGICTAPGNFCIQLACN
jgi:hypothetical protein